MKISYPIKGMGRLPGIFVSQKFGLNPDYYAHLGIKGHNGWDISCPLNTPIYAVADGETAFEIGSSTYGNHIFQTFEKEGRKFQAVYGHLNKFHGLPGKVREGDLIGFAGSTGFSTGIHLHFGIRELGPNGWLNYDNGFKGYFDPAPYWKIQAHYLKDGQEIILAIPLDTMDRWDEFLRDFYSLRGDYQLEEHFWNFNKPWPKI